MERAGLHGFSSAHPLSVDGPASIKLSLLDHHHTIAPIACSSAASALPSRHQPLEMNGHDSLIVLSFAACGRLGKAATVLIA
jgi:hypothetical protein